MELEGEKPAVSVQLTAFAKENTRGCSSSCAAGEKESTHLRPRNTTGFGALLRKHFRMDGETALPVHQSEARPRKQSPDA